MLLSELAALITQTIARHGDGEVMATYEGVAVPIADLYRTNPTSADLPEAVREDGFLLQVNDGECVDYRAQYEHPADRDGAPIDGA